MAEILRFIIPSALGIILFLVPVPQDGTLNTILGIIIDWAKETFKPFLTVAAMVLVVLSAVITLYASLVRPNFISHRSHLQHSHR